jgi:hypothetical protein
MKKYKVQGVTNFENDLSKGLIGLACITLETLISVTEKDDSNTLNIILDELKSKNNLSKESLKLFYSVVDQYEN